MLKRCGGSFLIRDLRLALIQISLFDFGERCLSRRGFTVPLLSVYQMGLLCPGSLPGARSLSLAGGRQCLQQCVQTGFLALLKLLLTLFY